MERLREFSQVQGVSIADPALAALLDAHDDLAYLRDEFFIPKQDDGNDTIYLCGNSLGLQPKRTGDEIQKQLHKWAEQGVEGHFTEPTQWLTIDDTVQESMARLVGALPGEVAVMNSLTVNLHLMMTSFYRPTQERYKILIESKAFPSDYHAVTSQIQLNGFNPSLSLVELSPRPGEHLIAIEDIEDLLEREGHTIAVVLIGGVQYHSGQFFDLERIANSSKRAGCIVGFDLAHAVGNVQLRLHEWQCDFAVWCSYKYLNCGPGSIGGCFVHQKHSPSGAEDSGRMRLAGWWGHRIEDRFQMKSEFMPCVGAYGFRLSNPPVLLIACIRASLDLFDKAGLENLRRKSLLLTSYLSYLLIHDTSFTGALEIVTPSDEERRGCQLSLLLSCDAEVVASKLKLRGMICDSRKDNILRIAPVPFYNSFSDVLKVALALKDILIPY